MSIEIIDILKPKNGLSFKLIEDVDIAVQGYESLADAVSHFVTQSAVQQIINAALSGKQDTLSSAQLAACNSGITSELVAQISLNTSAIAGKASQSDLAALSATVATKANASDLTTATTDLQAQIDAIVTPVTQDAEVQNARVGSDGTSYISLKSRLDTEFNRIKPLGETLKFPKFLPDSEYDHTSGADCYAIYKTIASDSFINTITITNGVATNFAVYILKMSDNEVIYKNTFSAGAGQESFDIKFKAPVDCYVVFGNSNAKWKSGTTDSETWIAPDGLYQCSPASADVGDTMTLTKAASTKFSFAVQLEVFTHGVVADIQDEVAANKSDIDTLKLETDAVLVTKNVTYPNSGYINKQGEIVENPDFSYSDYISAQKLNPDVTIYWHSLVATFAFYNQNKEFISYISSETAGLREETITIPNNAVYVRVSTDTSYNNKVYYTEVADVAALNSEVNTITGNVETLNSEMSQAQRQLNSLFEKTLVTYPNNGYINKEGEIVANQDFFYSDFIDAACLQPNVKIYWHNLVATFSFYNQNKEFISYISETVGLREETITIPADAVYARVCTDTSYDNKVYYNALILEEEIEERALPIALNLDNGNLLRYKEVDGEVGYFGRWYNYNGHKCTNNDGAELYFKVAGANTITIDLEQISVQEVTPYFAYSIDGGSFTRQQITQTTISLPDTDEHIVRIVIDGMTEAQGGSKWAGTLGIYLNSLTVNAGTLKGLEPLNRVGMFFGDSLTEGINALYDGNREHGWADASVNSAVAAFPYYCCKALNAVSHRAGYGGSGMVNDGSFRPCIDAIDYFNVSTKTPTTYPDFIVINHGINDSAATDQQYADAYVEVINRLRIKYTSTPIFCVVPFKAAQPHSADIETICNAYSNTYFVSSANWNGNTTDGTHLSASGAEHNGNLLAQEILKVLGKDFFAAIK